MSYLAHKRYLYAKCAGGVIAFALLLFMAHDPLHGASGGTWLGYSLGVTSLALMIWLAWLGIRKRQYQAGRAQMREWTSAHVYLGLALWVLVTLHTGFRFGANLHFVAYFFLCLVVLSGLYGVVAYASLPDRISKNRRDLAPAAMLIEIQRLDDTALRLADKVSPEIHAIVSRSVANVQIGGNAWQQLTGRYRGKNDRGLQTLSDKRAEQLRRSKSQSDVPLQLQTLQRSETVMMMADQLFDSKKSTQAEDIKRTMDLLAQRKSLVERLNIDITLKARLTIWLFIHVPLTVGLLIAVLAHLIAVFYYF